MKEFLNPGLETHRGSRRTNINIFLKLKVSDRLQCLTWFLSLSQITCGHTVDPTIKGLFLLTGIKPTSFRKF